MSHRTFLVIPALLALGCPTDQNIGTHNAAPEASITSHTTGDVVLEGDPLTLRGVVSDEDHAAADLQATWLAGGDVICPAGAPADDGISACETSLEPGQENIRLEVRDPKGALGASTVTLIIQPTEAPTATILAPEADGTWYSDQKITFVGQVSDAEDEPEELMVWWESDLDGPLDLDTVPSSGGTVSDAVLLSQGEHFLTLNVLDSGGKSDADSVVITVGPPNSAPNCAITAPENGAAGSEGDMVVFEGEVSDPDIPANWLNVAWGSDTDGALGTSTPGSDGTVAFPWDTLSVGTHVITLTATDEVGADCSDWVLYTVGTPPSLTLEAPASGDVVAEGGTVTFTARVSDSEDAPTDLTLSWVSSLDDLISNQGADSTGLAQFTSTALSAGTHSLTVTVTDLDGLYAVAMVTFTVNGLPSAPVVSISPDPALTTDALHTATDSPSVDPEGATVTYAYAWYQDGVLSSASSSSTLPASATTKGEVWRVVVTPNDGLSDGPTGQDSLTIDNSAPVLASATLTPDPATTASTLTCTPGSASDADGDSITYSTTWSVSGADPGVRTATLAASYTSRGDDVTCTVIPTDGRNAGTAVTSNIVAIGNSAPSVASVAISPDPAFAGDSLTCAWAGFTDPDGDSDASTAAWTVNGSTAGSGTTLTSVLVGGDVVVCNVTPSDGTDTGTPTSATLTVANSAPSVASASISPASPQAGDTLTCTYSGYSDPDGDADASTLAWSVDGVAAGSGATLTGGFSGGDTVTCTVTPSDGADAGTPVQASVTVANTAPSISSVSISPSAAYADSVLTCLYSGYSDPDGDADDSTYAWTVDGVAAGNTDTLMGAFTGGDVVTCTITPSDGTDDGTPVGASLTVRNSAPSVSRVTISPNPAHAGDTLTCAWSDFDDLDGDADASSVAWAVGGAAAGTGTTLSGGFAGGDIVTCTVTPSDGSDTGTPVSASLTVANSAPSITNVSITPDPARVADTLSCAYTGFSDPDGDADASSYAWAVDGAAAGSGGTLASAFARGNTVTCTVSPSDGSDAGTPLSDSLVISNTAPVIASLTLSPSAATTNSILTVGLSSSDADGDSVGLSYAWAVDGAAAGTGTTLNGATAFDKGQTVQVTVIPDDGIDAGSPQSASLLVGNTPPGAPGVSVDPTAPEEGSDDLVCQVDTPASDADGDSISYTITWTVDGADYPSDWDTGFTSGGWTGPVTTTLTDDTIPAGDLLEGEVWTCTVTPDDGDDDGTPASASATVAAAAGCVTTTSSYVLAGPHAQYGFCWYLGGLGQSCDTVCAAIGGSNLAYSAENEWSDHCSAFSTEDVSYWFYVNGNAGGWSGAAGSTSYHTLGYGYTGQHMYGKCASGTASGNGAYPGDPNGSSTRSVICACFTE